MSSVPDSEITSKSQLLYAYHGIFKEFNNTTKLRVGFDGSAKTDSELSHNDVSMTGTVIQDELITVLLRIREHSITITSDTEKIYRKIYISLQQRGCE